MAATTVQRNFRVTNKSPPIEVLFQYEWVQVTVLATAGWGFSACSIPSQLDLKSIHCTETVILCILALAGVLSLPVDSLRDSPPHLRVREVKEW